MLNIHLLCADDESELNIFLISILKILVGLSRTDLTKLIEIYLPSEIISGSRNNLDFDDLTI